MTDGDLDLGELDSEEGSTFPPPERKVVTQAYDLSVDTLLRQWNDNTLVIPTLQREYVWDNGRASRLLESLMLNLPIPPVFFAETRDAKYEVIDGHQRILSIVRYMQNQFPLSALRIQGEFQRKRFHQLPPREQRFLSTRVLRAIIITVESHPNMKFEIFQRLNTGAIALNAQEIRNALNQGPVNDLLKELARSSAFRECIGTKTPRKRMVDEELALRFLAISHGLSSYRPPLLRFLNDFMRTTRMEDLADIRSKFESASILTASCFPRGAYRITDKSGAPLERNVNRALFDAQMVAASWVTSSPDTIDTAQVRRKAADLYTESKFLNNIRLATGDRRRTIERIRMYAEMLAASGVTVAKPDIEI